MKSKSSQQRKIRLRELAWELKTMSYLIERSGYNPAPRLDEDEIYYGVSRILNRIARGIFKTANSLEEPHSKIRHRGYESDISDTSQRSSSKYRKRSREGAP